jgi:hypothetical protein
MRQGALPSPRRNVGELGQASAELFQTHPDYAIVAGFPGLVASTGTRVFTVIVDDRTRFVDARALIARVVSAPASLQLSPSRPLATCFGSDTDVRHSHVFLDFVRRSQVFVDGNAGSRPELVESEQVTGSSRYQNVLDRITWRFGSCPTVGSPANDVAPGGPQVHR